MNNRLSSRVKLCLAKIDDRDFAPQILPPLAEASAVVSGGGEDSVDAVALAAFEKDSAHAVVIPRWATPVRLPIVVCVAY